MDINIIAAESKLAFVADEPLPAGKRFKFTAVKEGGQPREYTTGPTRERQGRIFKATPSGWRKKQKPGDQLDISVDGGKPQAVVVLTDDEYKEVLKRLELEHKQDSGGDASRNGRDVGDEELFLSFPIPVQTGDTVRADAPLEARARRLLQRTLGPVSDYASADVLKRALARRTELLEQQGVELVRWRSGLGGVTDVETEVTGAQAGDLSLAIQVREIAGEIVETLAAVFPNRNPSAIQSTREVLRGLLDEVVEELSRTEISTAVLGTLAGSLREALSEFGEALGYLDQGGELEGDEVILNAEETELTRFRILQRWVIMEAQALEDLSTPGGGAQFGTAIHELEQFLDGAGQAANDVRTALDQFVDFGALERQNFEIDLGDDRTISLDALLERVENRIAVSYRAQVGVAGRTAVVAGIPSLELALSAATKLVTDRRGHPIALRYPIVRQSLRELREQLEGARDTARTLEPADADKAAT